LQRTAALTVPVGLDLSAAAESGATTDPDGTVSLGVTTAPGDLESRQRFHGDDASPTPARRHYDRDLEAMRRYRPGYRFWHHVFTVPDGRIAYGSASDGSLLATFPLRGNWSRDAEWQTSSLTELLAGQLFGGRAADRREAMAERLTQAAGPVLYNATRGSFIAEGTERYGSFLTEWGSIFERFAVPAEVGLAQVLVESGLKGRIRSEAEAIGFCQWLPGNWERLQALSPHVIEAYNQTTQAPYCAAHLAILATKYGSLIPALSEHHAGALNVGRTIVNGDFAGGNDVRDRYCLGAELTLLVRQIRVPGYREVAGSYGPRSFRYAEMVFGNVQTIAEFESSIPQEQIFAMRPDRAVSLDEVASRTGLTTDEIRRFNPALINRVPAAANLYLPFNVEDFGPDTAFWHRAPTRGYLAVLGDFQRLDQRFAAEDWHDGSIFDELRAFEARFRATATEEGTVMASVLAYVIDEHRDGRQMEILAGVRSSERARLVLEQGARQMQVLFKAFDDGGAGRAHRNAFLTAASFGLR
jgi:hypothetical protein